MILDELQGWILSNLTSLGEGDICQVLKNSIKSVFVDEKTTPENSNTRSSEKEFEMI
jgi:hypothetical protein